MGTSSKANLQVVLPRAERSCGKEKAPAIPLPAYDESEDEPENEPGYEPEESGGSSHEEEIASDDSDRDEDYQEAHEFEDKNRESNKKQLTKQINALLQNRNLVTISHTPNAVSIQLIPSSHCGYAGLWR